MPRGVYNRNGLNEGETASPEEAPVLSARASETRRERRRRDDGDLDRGARLKLAIPAEIREQAKREGKTLRWINDEGNRMHDMTVQDDWDVVDHPMARPVPVGTSVDGNPIMARLCSKHQDWYDEDQRDKAKVLKEREKAVERGSKADPTDNRQEEVSYTPRGNRISRGG